jgi:hypothetical protein
MIAAYLSAVLGPVVDVTCNPFGYKAERSMMSIMKLPFTLNACVYDACIVLRPAAHFRNSTNVRHTIDPRYLQDLPFNDSLLMAAVSAHHNVKSISVT